MSKQGPPHDFKIAQRGIFVAAVCVCGWEGPKRAHRYEAERDGEDHAVYTARTE